MQSIVHRTLYLFCTHTDKQLAELDCHPAETDEYSNLQSQQATSSEVDMRHTCACIHVHSGWFVLKWYLSSAGHSLGVLLGTLDAGGGREDPARVEQGAAAQLRREHALELDHSCPRPSHRPHRLTVDDPLQRDTEITRVRCAAACSCFGVCRSLERLSSYTQEKFSHLLFISIFSVKGWFYSGEKGKNLPPTE